MNIRIIKKIDENEVIKLIAKFRVVLAKFKNRNKEENLEAAKEELEYYKRKKYPIYLAEIDSKIVGYLVCKVEDDIVWAESLYVLPEYRNRGIGTMLYSKAEELAKRLGQETVYNWVHPNNHKIIKFLAKRGYDVLNLIEIRGKIKGEKITKKIKIGKHSFKY